MWKSPIEEALHHEEDVAQHWYEKCVALQNQVVALEQDVEAERNRGEAWRDACIGVQADNEDLRGVIRELKCSRDSARVVADYARLRAEESKEDLHRMEKFYDSRMEVIASIYAEFDRIVHERDDLRAEFDRYREYTQAGFKALYHERRYGPAEGAPGTEDTFTWRVGKGKRRRIVSYPAPPEPRRTCRELETELNAT